MVVMKAVIRIPDQIVSYQCVSVIRALMSSCGESECEKCDKMRTVRQCEPMQGNVKQCEVMCQYVERSGERGNACGM